MPAKEQRHDTMPKPRSPRPESPSLESLDQHLLPPAVIARSNLDHTSLTPGHLLQLQRTIGNRAVQRLLQRRTHSDQGSRPAPSPSANTHPSVEPPKLRTEKSIQRAFTVGKEAQTMKFDLVNGGKLTNILKQQGVVLAEKQKEFNLALFGSATHDLFQWLDERGVAYDKEKLINACFPTENQPQTTSKVSVAWGEVQSALQAPGTPIGTTKYTLAVEGKKIYARHASVGDVNCHIEYEDLGDNVLGVKNIVSRPYDGNGLGVLLVAAFLILAENLGKDQLTLTTDNTAPVFWAGFGLQQKALKSRAEVRKMVSGINVKDPPIKKE